MKSSQMAAIKNFLDALQKLHDEKVLINKKDFTCQIGEWLVETIYKGKRATSGIQKAWDVQADGKFIQIKTHSKAQTNSKNRWSGIGNTDEAIDELIIIEFTQDYKLVNFYKIPWNEALRKIVTTGKKKHQQKIYWNALEDFRVDFDTLPDQDTISFFL
jgi:hypothetical protein